MKEKGSRGRQVKCQVRVPSIPCPNVSTPMYVSYLLKLSLSSMIAHEQIVSA